MQVRDSNNKKVDNNAIIDYKCRTVIQYIKHSLTIRVTGVGLRFGYKVFDR